MGEPITTFFIPGGTLRPDAPSYVERRADHDLLDGLLRGEFCYVLTSRQMGKSSLMVRTAVKLRKEGVQVVVLDLTAIGQNLTPEQWYDGMMTRIGRQLRLEAELDQFWQASQRLSPVQRFCTGLHDVVMKARPGKLVVFVDETDTVRSLPFSTDEFFAAIRECYNRRAEEPEFKNLTFCLLGVAKPSDLIRDTRLTPFNIGRRIELSDLTEGAASALTDGLPPSAKGLLDRVFHWTGGHPYLTQRLCLGISEYGATNEEDVDELCSNMFLSASARERDDNLIFVRERMLNSEIDRLILLQTYQRVLASKSIADNDADPLISVLKLSGIVRPDRGYLKSRNRIYGRVFDRKWCQSNLPDAEVRRQRSAFRRGMAGTVAGVVVIGAVSMLPLFAPGPEIDPPGVRGLTKFTLPAPKTEVALNASPTAPDLPQTAPTNAQTPPLTNAAASAATRPPLPAIRPLSAVVLELAGTVEIMQAGANRWILCYTNQSLVPGDQLRTGPRSRAAIQLSDGTLFRMGEQSYVRIRTDEKRRRSAFDLLRGYFYLINPSEDPAEFDVEAPSVKAKVRG